MNAWTGGNEALESTHNDHEAAQIIYMYGPARNGTLCRAELHPTSKSLDGRSVRDENAIGIRTKIGIVQLF